MYREYRTRSQDTIGDPSVAKLQREGVASRRLLYWGFRHYYLILRTRASINNRVGIIVANNVFEYNGGIGRLDMIAHELGHVLELEHTATSTDLMSSGSVRSIPNSFNNIYPDGADLDQLDAVVMNWAISQSMIAQRYRSIACPLIFNLKPVAPESTGLLNIAQYRRPASRSTPDSNDDRRDTVYARTVLDVSRAHRVRLLFGYSDDVTAFLDGRAVVHRLRGLPIAGRLVSRYVRPRSRLAVA